MGGVRDGGRVGAQVGLGAAPGHVDVAGRLDPEPEERDRRDEVVVELGGRAAVEPPVRQVAVDLVAEKALDVRPGLDAGVRGSGGGGPERGEHDRGDESGQEQPAAVTVTVRGHSTGIEAYRAASAKSPFGAMPTWPSPRESRVRIRTFVLSSTVRCAYAELHCHTNFSFLDGASAPDELVERAVELGPDRARASPITRACTASVRFSDRRRGGRASSRSSASRSSCATRSSPDPAGSSSRPGGASGAAAGAGAGRSGARRLGRREGVPDRPRPERARLPGHREAVKEDRRGIGERQRGPHLVLLARDATGYRSLCRLVSRANLAGTKAVPRFDQALLAEHAEGLVALSGCREGEIARRLRVGRSRRARGRRRRCSRRRYGRRRVPSRAVAPPPARRRLARRRRRWRSPTSCGCRSS